MSVTVATDTCIQQVEAHHVNEMVLQAGAPCAQMRSRANHKPCVTQLALTVVQLFVQHNSRVESLHVQAMQVLAPSLSLV